MHVSYITLLVNST